MHGVCAKRRWAKLHSVKLDIEEVLKMNEINKAGINASMKKEKNQSVTTLKKGRGDKVLTRLFVRHLSDRTLVANQSHCFTPFL